MMDGMVELPDTYMRITDARMLRALAHPARIAILEHLSTGVSATATECAEICGLSPSATSYHLRALARFGLVEEAPNRGDARERVWKVTHRGFYTDVGPHGDAAARSAERMFSMVTLDRSEERARAWWDRMDSEPQEWYEAVMFGVMRIAVTAEELAGLNEAVRKLFDPYRIRDRTNPPDGSRAVIVDYRAFPVSDLRLPGEDVKH